MNNHEYFYMVYRYGKEDGDFECCGIFDDLDLILETFGDAQYGIGAFPKNEPVPKDDWTRVIEKFDNETEPYYWWPNQQDRHGVFLK